MPRRPVEVQPGNRPPSSAGHSSTTQFDPHAAALKRRRVVFWSALGLCVVGLLGLGLWNLAYYFGKQHEQAALKPYINTPGDPALGQPNKPLPESPQKAVQSPAERIEERPFVRQAEPERTETEVPKPAPEAPLVQVPKPKPFADTRENGKNYLELGTLTYKDAVSAVEYLTSNGLKASIAPAQRGVDPGKAATNNLPHVVFLAEGVASDRFKATQAERQKLEARVEQLGKKYQRELKGPTDFSRPMWRLYKD